MFENGVMLGKGLIILCYQNKVNNYNNKECIVKLKEFIESVEKILKIYTIGTINFREELYFNEIKNCLGVLKSIVESNSFKINDSIIYKIKSIVRTLSFFIRLE